MKIKLKLEQIIDNRQEKTESWTFIFKPTLDDWKKRLSLKISSSDPMETMGKLGLPQSVGDTVILEMHQKEEQKKLEE